MTGLDGFPATLLSFLPPPGWWWDWRDEGRVIVWTETDTTIAFREEIEGVIAEFAPKDPPSAGAIVSLLAACRDDWDGERVGDMLHGFVRRCGGSVTEHGEVVRVVSLLGKVRALPEDLRRSAPARSALVSMVMEQPIGSAGASGSALEPSAPTAPHRASLGVLRSEWGPLVQGLVPFSEAALRLRIATGLDEPPSAADPADWPLPRHAAQRGVPPELLDDPETSAVASLARQVMAAVALPRPLDAPFDLPEGGYADITNRGPLDRLLLSELAHDESTFAARLALGEALYLRRELSAPPPPRGRLLLLDSGVRMWGVPRAYAAAVALALRAQAGPDVATTAFRACRGTLVPVDLGSRDGLVDHLQALEIDPHPGAALEAFAAIAATAHAGTDAVLVTCEETLADPEFERLATLCPFDLLHLISVARDGRLRLLARSRRGTRVVREAVLDAAEVLSTAPRGAPGRRPARPLLEGQSHDLPAIFGVDPFPLRVAHQAVVEHTWAVDGVGTFSYTPDGRLLLWDTPTLGARQIASGLPNGRLIAFESIARGGQTLAVVGKLAPNGLHALQIDCRSFRVEAKRLENTFPGGSNDHVQIVSGRILVRHKQALEEIDPHSGKVLSTCHDLPQMGTSIGRKQLGRVLRHTSQGTIVLAAGPAHFEIVSGYPAGLAIFETIGVEGFTVVTPEGNLIVGSPSHRAVVPHGLGRPLDIVGVSRDGRRIALAGASTKQGREYRVIDVLSKAPIGGVQVGHQSPDLEKEMMEGLRAPSVRRKFVFVCLDGNDDLMLVSRDAQASLEGWRLTGGSEGLEWTSATHVRSRPVHSLERDGRRNRFGLRRARFPDGTTVWLDPRGLLHLRSSVPGIPEVTLTTPIDHHPSSGLTGSAGVAGWASDGRLFGLRYFHGRDATDDRLVWTEILRPMLDAIRD